MIRRRTRCAASVMMSVASLISCLSGGNAYSPSRSVAPDALGGPHGLVANQVSYLCKRSIKKSEGVAHNASAFLFRS
jgi:hypothetical protein